jgi:ATP-dependent Clp endopeptidase proteolytic subunit ClpP
MKFWNLEVGQGEDGTKVLDVSLFGDIDPGFFGDGVASKDIAAQLAANADAKKITVRINSLGGDLFGGLAIYNLLRNHGAEVTSIVEGIAASAASIVAMAGRTVMDRGSMLMIHNPIMGTFGDANDHRERADILDKARDSLLAVYQQKTGKKPGELRKMLDAETWLTAEDAKREGFADEIADKPVKARAEGSTVILNGVAFNKSTMPAPILAMTSTKTAPATAPTEDNSMEYSKEAIAAKAPELLNALLDEGRKAGAEAERARLKAIDELPVRGNAKMIFDAKYGAEPKSAEQLAVAVLKAEGELGAERLEACRSESGPATSVRQSAPEKTTQVLEREAAKNIARLADEHRRGGSR